MKGAEARVVWLESNGVDECARELASKLPINWLYNPLSRCISCNARLVRAREGDLAGIPEDVKVFHAEYTKCLNCGKVFWMGSHTDRMLAKLKDWAE